MYYLECQCKFRDRWNELEGYAPFASLAFAIQTARMLTMQRRSAVRVVDDFGNVWT